MIKFFNERNPLIFFPKKWANSVSRWILGIYSPTGTVKISNTANPDEHGSLALDVNIDAVLGKVEKRLQGRSFSAEERLQLRNIIFSFLDNYSVVVKDKRISVSEEWLLSVIANLSAGGSGGENEVPEENIHIDENYTDESDGYIPLSEWNWTAGGGGLKMDVYCEVISMEDGTHGLQKATLTFSEDGRLVSVEKQSGCKYITA